MYEKTNNGQEEYNLKFAKWEEQFRTYQDTNKKLQQLEEDIYIDKIAFIDYVRTLSSYINNNLDYLTDPDKFQERIKKFNKYIYSIDFAQQARGQQILKLKGAIDQILPSEEYTKKIEEVKKINADLQHELTQRSIKIKVESSTVRDLDEDLKEFRETIQFWRRKSNEN